MAMLRMLGLVVRVIGAENVAKRYPAGYVRGES